MVATTAHSIFILSFTRRCAGRIVHPNHEPERADIVRRRQHIVVAEIDFVLAGGDFAEIGGGNFLSDTAPEEKAVELREQPDVHYKHAPQENQ